MITYFYEFISEQANSSVEKAGILGSMKMRLLETDNKGSVRGETLMKAIQEDIEKGLIPTYVSVINVYFT